MSNVADVKPWFREDLARTLASIYFASQGGVTTVERRIGFAAALSSVALAVGVNPETFLKPEDVQYLKSNVQTRYADRVG